ncbi:MAG: hypothetical protein ABSG93_19305 [Solirubrobacteraceae bacterium]|jgi:hypothetical protein
MNIAIINQENAQVAEWVKEGKTLVAHGPTPPYATGKSGAIARAEAAALKLEGAVKRLFVREREEGWIAAGQFVEAQEQGLLDEIITPLTGGLLHGPAPGSTTAKVNPKTGRLEPEQHASGVESIEKALPSWGTFALKLLVNSALLIVAVVLIIAGIIALVKPTDAFPIPIPV